MCRIDGVEDEQAGRMHPACVDVMAYWQQRADATGGIPRLADIDLMDIWQHASHITIKDAESDSVTGRQRFRWRYAGTMLYELTGQELTGRYMDEVYEATDEVLEISRHIITSGNLQFSKRTLRNTMAGWAPVPYECLNMPLKNNQGIIAHILSIYVWPEQHLKEAGSSLRSKDHLNYPPTLSGHLVSRHNAS